MEFVTYEQKGAYAIITISREKALNALNSTVLDELNAVLDDLYHRLEQSRLQAFQESLLRS